MNSLTFLNAPILWGLTLASIPLIIHLLFRRRYRRVEWAPMQYLKLTIQRNRKRIRIEQLLLLLLRTAMIALLVLLVARPVMHAEGLGAWLSGASHTSQLVLLDDSLSMGFRQQGRSSFEHAQELAQRLAADLGAKNRLTLALASQPEAPLVRDVELSTQEDLARLIRETTTADVYVDWTPALAAADALLTAAQYPIQDITLITDLARAGWRPELDALVERWQSRDVRLRIFDVGFESDANAALVGLDRVDHVLLSGVPARFVATIRNFSRRDLAPADATWLVDGQPTLVSLPALPAQETTRVPLIALFQTPGQHHVQLVLPADDLPADDSRGLVVNVKDKLKMLLVDGEPGTEPFTSETDFLALALSLGSGDADAYEVDLAGDSDWLRGTERGPDLIVFANLASVTAAEAARLRQLVSQGVGLVFFLGDQVDPDNYNQHLFADGQGLLPAALESVVDEDVSGFMVDAASPEPLAALAELHPAVLERIAARKVYQVRPAPEGAAAHVVARWNNPGASPLVLEKTVGRGRVLLWTLPADRAWSDWPTEPSYVLAMREMATAIAHADGGERNVVAGSPLRRPIAAGHDVPDATVETPRATAPLAMRVEATTPEGTPAAEITRALVHGDTRRAGLYRLSWKETPGGEQHDQFAVVPDARESDRGRIAPDELRALFGGLKPEIIAAVDNAAAVVSVRGQEIWRRLALGMLGLVVAEACFATWAGRQR